MILVVMFVVTFGCDFWMLLLVGIGDWVSGLGLGIGIGDWDWGIGLGIGDWDGGVEIRNFTWIRQKILR